MINNRQLLEQDVREAIKKFQAVEKHFAAKERRDILKEGGKVLVTAVRSKIPEATEDVYRYSTPKVKKKQKAPKGQGNVVAVYTPGNARRSYRVLPLSRTSDVFVGPKVSKKGGGVFSGGRVDGYYFHLLEYGSRFMGAVAPIRRGLAEAKGQISMKLRSEFERHMKKFIEKHAVR